jgi:hypothetical protein
VPPPVNQPMLRTGTDDVNLEQFQRTFKTHDDILLETHLKRYLLAPVSQRSRDLLMFRVRR